MGLGMMEIETEIGTGLSTVPLLPHLAGCVLTDSVFQYYSQYLLNHLETVYIYYYSCRVFFYILILVNIIVNNYYSIV